MSDIFISYSSKDRPWVERFAKVLAARGWSVWWDRNIPTGESFNAVIRQELRAAKCAIVVWSESPSIPSGSRRKPMRPRSKRKLPVRIDESEIPLGFTQRTFQSLVAWEADADHPGFSQLLKYIERLVKNPPTERTEVVSRPWWKRVHPLWLVSIPTVSRGGDREWPHVVADFDSHSSRIDD